MHGDIRESYLAGRTDGESGRPDELDLTACVPLRLNGKVWGSSQSSVYSSKKNGFETATTSCSSFWLRRRQSQFTVPDPKSVMAAESEASS